MIVCMLSRKLGEKRWTQRKLAQKTGIRPALANAFASCSIKIDSCAILRVPPCPMYSIIYIPDNENPT